MKMSRALQSKLLSAIQKVLSLLGLQAIRREKYEMLRNYGFLSLADRWGTKETTPQLKNFIFSNFNKSHAQLQQDLWALYEYQQKYSSVSGNGFFVEFGATDGILRSNTYLLEKYYGWKGILAEPARIYIDALRKNRFVDIDDRCVYGRSDEEVIFHEANSSELSGIKDFKHIGGWEDERKSFVEYTVATVSLHDFLLQHKAPKKINYMSIDTEGSELEILKDFRFDNWQIECLSVEHNYSENEEKIDALMKKNGYNRVHQAASCWDAWYLKN
jgi:FkbM family methyltransferase